MDDAFPHDGVARLTMSSTVVEVEGGTEDVNGIHVVLLGDSTLDNGRYLNNAAGDLSVEQQLSQTCDEMGWDLTVLAQDGSRLEDVQYQQLPAIPDDATHIVMSASGNDLLALLNELVHHNFGAFSLYRVLTTGLVRVAERYRAIAETLKSLGCHLAFCTVYRPNFNHMFFKTLATFGLGLHNTRLKQISMDFNSSMIDLANLFDCTEDFANPLELSTRGGAKVVQNIAEFVSDHQPLSMSRYRGMPSYFRTEDDEPIVGGSALGTSLKCCVTRLPRHRIYCNMHASDVNVSRIFEEIAQPAVAANVGGQLKFSEEQEHWRHT